jgi:hypothetical protein
MRVWCPWHPWSPLNNLSSTLPTHVVCVLRPPPSCTVPGAAHAWRCYRGNLAYVCVVLPCSAHTAPRGKLTGGAPSPVVTVTRSGGASSPQGTPAPGNPSTPIAAPGATAPQGGAIASPLPPSSSATTSASPRPRPSLTGPAALSPHTAVVWSALLESDFVTPMFWVTHVRLLVLNVLSLLIAFGSGPGMQVQVGRWRRHPAWPCARVCAARHRSPLPPPPTHTHSLTKPPPPHFSARVQRGSSERWWRPDACRVGWGCWGE